MLVPGPRQNRALTLLRLGKGMALDAITDPGVRARAERAAETKCSVGHVHAEAGETEAEREALSDALAAKAEAEQAAEVAAEEMQDIAGLCLELRSDVERLRQDVNDLRLAVVEWRAAGLVMRVGHPRDCGCPGCTGVDTLLKRERAAAEAEEAEEEDRNVAEAEAEGPVAGG